jgi:hypothetical protein
MGLGETEWCGLRKRGLQSHVQVAVSRASELVTLSSTFATILPPNSLKKTGFRVFNQVLFSLLKPSGEAVRYQDRKLGE